MKYARRLTGSAMAIFATGLLASFAAQAADADGSPAADAGGRAAVVHYDDLDLTRAQGVRALYARLAAAAERVCGSYDARDARARRSVRACRQAALAEAVNRIDHAGLASLYESDASAPRFSQRITAGPRS